MQHVPIRVLRARGLLNKIPFTTVITDLSTCHPTWFHRSVTKCFCPTKDVEQRALKAGLLPSQLRVHGLPIRPGFGKPTKPKVELRRDLGMNEELPAVLLMGGGEGMGPVESTARALCDSLYDNNKRKPVGQLVVICGRNKKLVKTLESLDWKCPVKIEGFVTNMVEWMAASDCVISKAGPGTIAEATIRGLPMVLNSYIAGQEVGNVSFVVDNGAGKYCDKPKEIAGLVADWFGSKAAELERMASNAKKLGRPDAVFKIVHEIAELARTGETLATRKLMYT
ncbi:1,2-diacylglycerol 3-beta-galactosyltransferase [Marchantia polymorpha subsp. ruderalis]